MTDSDAEEIVTFRLAPSDRAAIQRLVEKGEFRNRSDFLRFAVKNGLRDYERTGASARVDLGMEAYELPAHESAAPRGRRGRKEAHRS